MVETCAARATRALDAAAAELPHEAHVRGPLRGGVGVGVHRDVGVELGVAEAVDRVAGARAARVEADDVEPVEQRLPEHLRGLGGVLRAGRARTAGVDHQRADPRPGSLAGTLSRARSIVRPSGWR